MGTELVSKAVAKWGACACKVDSRSHDPNATDIFGVSSNMEALIMVLSLWAPADRHLNPSAVTPY